MVYYKRYKKNYRKNRSSKVLKNRYIYGNKSASAQSKQIAALKTRLNYFARQNRPEIKTKFASSSAFTFDNSAASNTWKAYPTVGLYGGTADNDRVGNFVRVKSLTWYFTFEYYDNMVSLQNQPDSRGGMIRVLLLQYKKPVGQTDIPVSRNSFLENWSDSGSAYTQQVIVPLKTGITEEFRVLADRKWAITENKNQLIKKITVKPSNFRYTTDDKVNNVICVIITSGLHYGAASYIQYIKGTFSDKIVYTDA